MNTGSSFGRGVLAGLSSTLTMWCVGVGPMHPPKPVELGERVVLKPSPASTSAAVRRPQALFVCAVAVFAAEAHAMRTAATIAERTKHSSLSVRVMALSFHLCEVFRRSALHAAME